MAKAFQCGSTSIKGGFIYIVASRSMVLYTGVTSDLEKRIWQHRTKALGGFTARYDVNRLMYYEFYETIEAAIAREKQIKGLAAQEEARADRANES